MDFTCDKYELQQAAAVCARAAAAKSPVPALEGILITADSKLRLTGYDLKEGIYTDIDATVNQCGSIVVNSKFLGEMLRRMPDGIVSFVSDEEENICVKCGKNEYRFMGISTEDYPDIPSVSEINSLTLPMGKLKSMINQTIFAVSDNDIRPIYTGALFEIQGENVNIVAMDGYRLAKREESFKDSDLGNYGFVVPGDCLSDIERICSDDEDKNVVICIGSKHISFSLGDTVVISRRLEGEFMNYRKALPNEFSFKVMISRNELISCLERVSLIISEKNNSPVHMIFEDGRILLRCINPVGKVEDECSCEGSGKGMEIGFNNRYMLEALRASGREKLLICINSPSSPCIIKAEDESSDFIYMILPVRLKA